MQSRHVRIIKRILMVLIGAMICATVVVIIGCIELVSNKPKESSNEILSTYIAISETEQFFREDSTTQSTVPPKHVISTATIGSMGDLLMHKPIFDGVQYNATVQQEDGSYDFSSIFKFISEYISTLDCSVINLETTLCGTDNGYPFGGYPLFNCPDAIVDAVKHAGFDILLTANNHSYDTQLVGFKRTINIIRESGLEVLGTHSDADDTKWIIRNINGINIGMLCYTYATRVTEDGRPSLNDNTPISEAGLCNYFSYNNLHDFYSEVESYLNEMKAEGADTTIMYIHWGDEYALFANTIQKDIAQALCDLGIDVIIGGHPHVVQPIELLSSNTDINHKTVCLYSTGNAVSNQRRGYLSAINTAHTEDGVLFIVTFEKYSDDTVHLSSVDIIPIWVNKYINSGGKNEYNILPLDYSCIDNWKSTYMIGETTLGSAKDSYNRTMEIVGPGLEVVQEYLAQEKINIENNY